MNKQQLAAKIWESANKMRSKIEANEYKDYILGFIFYKFLSEKEEKYLKETDWSVDDLPGLTEDDSETVESVRRNLGYFIAYDNLFSTWLRKGSDFSVQDVRDALSAFSRLISPTHKKVFEGVFNTLQTGLSKLGENAAKQSKAINDLIQLIKDIPMDGKQDYDVLGFIYEYLISMFAANAGKKAGEFYTPHEVSLLMSEIVAEHLKNRNEIKIYDPTSGSGSLLINIGKSVSKYIENKNNIKYYAQELKQNTYNLTRMNLIMRGIIPDNIVVRNGDTLEDDWPFFEENDPIGTYDPLYVDAVVSNPPYSQTWNPSGKDSDPRYAGFGLAPKSKADYAFLLHDLYHIKNDGIMTIVLPHGVLFRGGEEGEIRKHLIEKNYIDAIIGLPSNIFFGTGIPTIIVVLKKSKSNTDVLIVDASKGYEKVGKNNRLRASDIKKIVDTTINRNSNEKFSKLVSREEIRNNDYNLNIPRYVDSSEKAESWDIYASMFGGIPNNEINQLEEYWKSFPMLKEMLFKNNSRNYSAIQVKDVKKSIQIHQSVVSFKEQFNRAFVDFDQYLVSKLIQGMETINISKSESVFAEEIFQRLNHIPLIDQYHAYQLLDDEWIKIATDLEMIQTEGLQAIKQVDPNYITKDNNEVQQGWKGRIIPFELVQDSILKEEKDSLQSKQDRLTQIAAEYEEVFESLNEEEKDNDFVEDDKFIIKEVKKALKSKDLEVELQEKLQKLILLNTEEKDLKSAIKSETELLEAKTKEVIETLTDDKALELLEEKWIYPLVNNLKKIPDTIIDKLVSKIEEISKKYETTFADIESEIEDTETALSAMIEELEADEFDMLGLQEFKKLLGGNLNE